MHEDLLGYLLGALSDDEQRRIENELAVNPQLRLELERLRQCLKPLESLSDDVDPPPALADLVLRALDQQEEDSRATPRSLADRNIPSSRRAGQTSHILRPHHYSVSDGIVLALVALIAITLFLPCAGEQSISISQDRLPGESPRIEPPVVRLYGFPA